MQIISTIAELRARLSNEQSIAFVPTMGNLHEGHLNLMRLAREHGSCSKGTQFANQQADCGVVCLVASIFVNPLQFGPNEDFDKYPRTLEADCARLQGLADVVFAPSVNEMYPEQQTIFVDPPPIANELCGATRPGHFRGMVTVVLKLLNIVQPHVALFGKKDYQQLHIIRQMVAQMNLPIRIVGGETVRAADGLALSSRNQYLSEIQRRRANFLFQTLQRLRDAIVLGECNFEQLQSQAVLALSAKGWVVDYVAIRYQSDLLPAMQSQCKLVILAAAKLGGVRLLDNLEINLPD
jgi:pantoate--beta-alanine ligase